MAADKSKQPWLIWIPVIVALLIFLPALDYGLVWDDTIFLRDMPLYRDSELWAEALAEPFVLSPNYFRPLALLSFVAELQPGGGEPILFHLTNLLLHALNTALVGLLACHLGRDGRLAALAGLLYAVHPALVEGVAFVSSRFDLLLTTFLLLALLAETTLRHRVVRPLAVGLAFLCAAMCKEMAAAFAVILPLWHLAQATPLVQEAAANLEDEPQAGKGSFVAGVARLWDWLRQSGAIWTYLACLAAGVTYLLLRYSALGYLLTEARFSSTVDPAGTPLQHLLLVGRSVLSYLWLIVWPFTSLTPIHYARLPVPATDLVAWLGLLVSVAWVALLVVWLRSGRERPAAWLVTAGSLALLPVINLRPIELGGGAYMAERFLLLPLALLALAAGSLVRLLIYRQPADLPLARLLRQAVPVAWLIACVATVQLTLPNWRDDLALWSWAAQRAPQSATPLTNLALEYVNMGDYEAGLAVAEQALALDPNHSDGWNNAGLALINLARSEDAEAAFRRAIELSPDNALFWNNLGGALRDQGELGEAERVIIEEALGRDVTLPAAHLNLGIVYLLAGRPDLAGPPLQEAQRLMPAERSGEVEQIMAWLQEPERWLVLGDLLLEQGSPAEAAAAFQQAELLGAEPADVAAGLSAALMDQQRWDEAQSVLLAALEVAPDDARLHNNYGVLAREQGDLNTARQAFARAVELAPDWELPQQNLEALQE